MRFPTRAGTENNLKILKDNHEYVLPTGWSLADAGSYDFNNKIEDRAFSHGGDVVGQSVQPNVNHMLGVKIHRHAPGKAGAGDTQVFETGLDEVVDHLVDPGAGL